MAGNDGGFAGRYPIGPFAYDGIVLGHGEGSIGGQRMDRRRSLFARSLYAAVAVNIGCIGAWVLFRTASH